MEAAEKKDTTPRRKVCGILLAHLSVPRLADVRPIQNSNDHPSIDVEFHILSTIPCKKHTVVKAKREWETGHHRRGRI